MNLSGLLDHCRSFLLEQDCLLCGATSRVFLCAECETDLPKNSFPHCPQCALFMPNGELCGACLTNQACYDITYAVYSYAFPMDNLIQSFKYGHRLALGEYLGQQMAERIKGISADLIIPLPLHPHRLRKRGFNQALELSRPVARILRLPIDTMHCQRIRDTCPQVDLPLPKRAGNVKGAFHCSMDFSKKRIILVDDVMTSGASLNECARILKRHGAAKVILLVAARAQI